MGVLAVGVTPEDRSNKEIIIMADTKTQAAPKKYSLNDLRKWAEDNMDQVKAFHAYSQTLKRNRETATVESAVRGVGTDMERLLGALDKISTSSGKKEEKTTAFPSPRGR